MNAGGARSGLGTLPVDLLQGALRRALFRGGDFAEIFVEDRDSLGMRLDDGRIDQATGGRELGFGVRLVDGEHTYYAHSDEVGEQALNAAADAVAAAAAARPRPSVVDLGEVRSSPGLHPVCIPPETVAVQRKAALLRLGNEEARAVSPEVVQVTVSYSEGRQRLLIVNSFGEAVRDDRTRLRYVVNVVARRDGVIQTGFEAIGFSAGFEVLDERAAAQAARSAAQKAVTMLDARPAPAGAMPVVLSNGFGGVLFHEACGHGLEADAVSKGASIYAGKMGQVVAAPIVNAYDDGGVPNGWGSAAFDDEGTPTRRTQVIENGRLCAYLYDRVHAGRQGVASSGNGRRQSFRHIPIPRMTTTYIAGGTSTRDEIFAATKRGFYAASLSGGQVEPASGAFVFGVAEGYLIEHGHITTPLRGATLIGSGIDILQRIDMIADDLEVKSGICGKDGQGVPVGTGQATLRVSEMTVGGTA
jgi:TldD protein